MPADSRQPTRRDRAQARDKKKWAGRKVNKYALHIASLHSWILRRTQLLTQ
jgi:hypothetical protein